VTGFLGWSLTYNATLKGTVPSSVPSSVLITLTYSSLVYNEVRVVQYSDAGAIVLVVLGSLFIAVTLTMIGILFLKRRLWIIRASSFLFLSLIGIGCCLGYATIYVFIGVPTFASCTMRLWLPSLAFVIVYASLLIKNWRYIPSNLCVATKFNFVFFSII